MTLEDIASGRHPFSEVLKAAHKPALMIGQGALVRADGGAILALARKIADTTGMVADGWNGFNVLHTAAARVGALDLGLLPGKGGYDVEGILSGVENGKLDVVYLLGADEIDMDRLEKAFVIYQGHHGDAGAHAADVILPGAAYTEKDATYVNTEGRVQRTHPAAFPPGDAKEDWAILRALSEAAGHRLPYDDLAMVRRRLIDVNPVFAKAGTTVAAAWESFGTESAVETAPLDTLIDNYYQTDPISRASKTMAECTALFVGHTHGRTGTNG